MNTLIINATARLSLIASSRRLLSSRGFMTLAAVRSTNQRNYQAAQFFRVAKMNFSQNLNENEVIELVEGKVFEVLKSAAKCNHSKLARTASFEELGFDSLDGVELVLAMEEHFGFDLSNQDAEKITTVMDAIQIFHTYYTKRH